MKIKATLVVLAFAAGMLASIAVAKPPPGHGKGGSATSSTISSTEGSAPTVAQCHPKVSMILRGSFVSAGSESFLMDVKSANRHGFGLAGALATVAVDAKTKFRRNGPAKLADLVAGDRLNVQVRACREKRGNGKGKAAARASVQPALLAKRVVAHPGAGSSTDGDSTTGPPSTETTTVATTATTATQP